MPNLPEHLVPEEFAGNEWFVEEQYERYQKDKNLVDPSWWPIFETIDKALGGAGTASTPSPAAAAPAAPATPAAAPAGSCSPHRSRGIEAYESACYPLPRTCYSES